MGSLLSIIVSLVIIVLALRIAVKVTGCLIRILIFAAALYLVAMALNFGFHLFTFAL